MKNLAVLLLLAAVLIATSVMPAEAKKKGHKVQLCHNGQTITVSSKALKAHLRHGDTRGPCSAASPGSPAPNPSPPSPPPPPPPKLDAEPNPLIVYDGELQCPYGTELPTKELTLSNPTDQDIAIRYAYSNSPGWMNFGSAITARNANYEDVVVPAHGNVTDTITLFASEDSSRDYTTVWKYYDRNGILLEDVQFTAHVECINNAAA